MSAVPCPRCLIRGPEGEALRALLEEWIDAIPEEEKTEGALYEARLSACRDCDALREGTCALCGCYVAYRAAKARMACPKVPSEW